MYVCVLGLTVGNRSSSALEGLTLTLLVANFANTKWCKKTRKWLKPWHIGTHLRVLSESYLMNTNMTGFGWLSRYRCILVLWTKVARALEGLKVKYLYLRLCFWFSGGSGGKEIVLGLLGEETVAGDRRTSLLPALRSSRGARPGRLHAARARARLLLFLVW